MVESGQATDKTDSTVSIGSCENGPRTQREQITTTSYWAENPLITIHDPGVKPSP